MPNPLLYEYEKLTAFLGLALGPNYEVALYDLTDKNRAIIALTNGHISGRSIGAPLTEALLQSLTEQEMPSDCVQSVQGKSLRCSAHFIEQDEHKIGLLSVSFDDSRFRELSAELLRLCHPDSFAPFEQFDAGMCMSAADKVPDTASAHRSIDALKQTLAQYGLSASRLSPDERVKIIQSLKADGTFQMKGAVKDVARVLHCSQASIYRYISQSASR